MGGRKRSASGTMLEYSTHTDNTSGQDSNSDNEEPIPRSSKQTKHQRNLSWIDSNYELLKENPFLLKNVLDCLCGHSSPQALFKYRLVGQHIWNELAVKAINEDRTLGVRLVKIIDPNRTSENEKRVTERATVVVININELIAALMGGKLESILTRVYLNSSLTHFHLNEFLKLNGQNIRTLHYDGNSWKDLKQILQSCAKNLTNLSLWRTLDENEGDEELFRNDDEGDGQATFKLLRLESLVIVSGRLDPDVKDFIDFEEPNRCHLSQKFLTDIFQASPKKSLSARFYNSFILDSGLSFKNLTTLCIKFSINVPQLRALCRVGLRLQKLCLQGLFIDLDEENFHYHYLNHPEWIDFRVAIIGFLDTQANTLEYFAVSLFLEKNHHYEADETKHDSPFEDWSHTLGFPIMPILHTFILYECSGTIPKEQYYFLFPKLRNLEIVECKHRHVGGPQMPNIMDYPLEIPISLYSSMFVQSLQGIKPTLEMARIFPSVTEFHIEGEIPHELPIYWPKLKHLYYKESYGGINQSNVVAYLRQIIKFLVGISPEESEWIEELLEQYVIRDLTNLQLPRSQPSVFDLNELETFEFGFISYEFEKPNRKPWLGSALGLLITLGLSRMTHLKKLNFVLEQKPRPRRFSALPQKPFEGLTKTFWNRKDLNISTNCNKFGRARKIR